MKNQRIKQYLLSPTCLKCGSFFCNDSLFCNVCFQIEIGPRIYTGSLSHLAEFQHYYLLEWNKNESNVLSQMVYRLKSDNSLPAWSYYSKLLIKKININFNEYAGFVPIPGSKQSSIHSLILARELSNISGLPVFDILSRKKTAIEQKRRSAVERENEDTISLKKQQSVHFTKCIFVDDILTTGQSFLQSNRAVNGLKENIIITLFYRSRIR